jgi:hypothetical protein
VFSRTATPTRRRHPRASTNLLAAAETGAVESRFVMGLAEHPWSGSSCRRLDRSTPSSNTRERSNGRERACPDHDDPVHGSRGLNCAHAAGR